MLGTGAAATLAMAGTQGLVSGFHHCHKGDLLEQLAQHLLAVDGLPVERISSHLPKLPHRQTSHQTQALLPGLDQQGVSKSMGPPLGSARKARAWTCRPSTRLIGKKELQC